MNDAILITPGDIDAGLEGIAARFGIRVYWKHLGQRKGEYRHHARVIAISPRCSTIQARCALAHELGHAIHGDDATTQSISAAQERRATLWAALTLIDLSEYAIAEQTYGEHPGTLARELEVTVDLVIALQNQLAHTRSTARFA